MRRGRLAFGLTVAGFAWAAALVPAALLVPVYSGKTESGSGDSVSTSATLVGENGLGVLLPIAIPAAVAALVWLALHRRCTHGTAAYWAWSLVALLAAFSFVAAASIGMFLMPIALLLAGAAMLTPAAAVTR
jgi:hypothetical protein